jgi:hypothetical protein
MQEPNAASPAIVFVFILFLSGIIGTILVVSSILRYGAKTMASKLTLYLNLSAAVWMITKIPYLLSTFKIGCPIGGAIHWYCQFNLLILTYYIADALHIRMLNENESISNRTNYLITWKTLISIFAIPILPVIYPISTHSFVSIYMWCGLSREDTTGVLSRTIFILTSSILQMAILIKFIRMCQRLRTLPAQSYADMLKRLCRGPGAYAAVLLIFTLLEDVVIFGITTTSFSSSDSNKHSFWSEYTLLVLQGCYVISYGIVYFFFAWQDLWVSNIYRSIC